MKVVLFSVLCVVLCINVFSQKKKETVIQNNKAKSIIAPAKGDVNIKNLNQYNVYKLIDQSSVYSFKVNKYIDFKKPLKIDFGRNIFQISAFELDSIKNFSVVKTDEFESVNFRIWKNGLSFNVDQFDFDNTLMIRIRNNELVYKKNYYLHTTDSSLEFQNQYGIPVLQILLKKSNNSIQVGGLFFYKSFVGIAGLGKGLYMTPAHMPYLQMNQEERDKYYDQILEMARTQIPSIVK